jgi:hypothetical protein
MTRDLPIGRLPVTSAEVPRSARNDRREQGPANRLMLNGSNITSPRLIFSWRLRRAS